MTLDELRDEMQVQLEYMKLTVKELVALLRPWHDDTVE